MKLNRFINDFQIWGLEAQVLFVALPLAGYVISILNVTVSTLWNVVCKTDVSDKLFKMYGRKIPNQMCLI